MTTSPTTSRPKEIPPALASYVAATADDLVEYGRKLAAWLPSETAVAVLSGELGAGKTTLTKGLAEGLGVAPADEVASPSYTLIHEYQAGNRSLYHLDLYRVDTAAQASTLGLDDILAPAPGKTVVIEWGEKLGPGLPHPALHVVLDILPDDSHRARARWLEAPSNRT